MKEILKLGLVLLIICLVAATALAFTNELTAEKIQEQIDLKNEQARKAVLPDAEAFEPIPVEELTALQKEFPILQDGFIGKAGDQVVGYVIRTMPSGYAGGVEVVSGINKEGLVTGMRVGKHAETPGLGAKAILPEFYTQYDNKKATVLTVNKTKSSETEIQAIAGSTITSKAVTLGVSESGRIVEKLLGK